MQPLSAFAAQARRAIRGVLCDIDDTLTNGGKLTSAAYAALEQLQRAGLLVVPITGRPAGWCDQIARLWPADGVVGENGAFYFRYDQAKRVMQRRFVDDDTARAAHRRRLAAIRDQIVAAVPGCAVAADQHYRETDLAIDYCEDVAPLPLETAERIAALMRTEGLTAKISSIHVNGWLGAYDKLAMTKLLFAEVFKISPDMLRQEFAFAGDSPNDAPMFSFFEYSVGVANVARFAGRLEPEPKYVTRGAAGAGFAELAAQLLAHLPETR